jgi:hypothetical protein
VSVALPDDVERNVRDGMEVRDAVKAAYGDESVVHDDCVYPITDGRLFALDFFGDGVVRALSQYRDKVENGFTAWTG